MFVGVNDCFTGNAVEFACDHVILDMERRFDFQPAGYSPDFPVNEILQGIYHEPGRIDIDTVQRAGKIARVSRSVVHQLRDFFDISCVDDAMVFQSQATSAP